MNENEFEIDGVKYVAKPVKQSFSQCKRCVFFINDYECKAMSNGTPQCYSGFRADCRDVYFVKADQ